MGKRKISTALHRRGCGHPPSGSGVSPVGLDCHENRSMLTKNENTLILSERKKIILKPWQKERGLDGANPLDITVRYAKTSTAFSLSYCDYVPENSKHSPSSGIDTRPSLPCFLRKSRSPVRLTVA